MKASEHADMPQTAAITLALASLDARPGTPLPEAALRLGRFLLERQGES